MSKTFHLSPFGNIRTSEEKKYYSLSHPQKRELITEKTCPGTNFGNMPFTVKFNEDVDYGLLENAINTVLYKNDGLRLRLEEIDYDYKQYVYEHSKKKLDFFDFSSEFGKVRYEKWLKEQIKKPLELINSDLFYFALIKWSEQEGGFYVNVHHIIGDGWTMKLIIEDIIDIYNKLKEKIETDNTKNPSYIEYIRNENTYLNSSDFENDKEFWLEKFRVLPEEIVLPWNKRKDYDIKSSENLFTISKELTEKITEFCNINKTSFYRLFNAVLFAYLSRITGNSEITAGVLTHNRGTEKEKKMTGMFVNTFPLRLNVQENMTFKELLKISGEELRLILKNHSRYPYDVFARDLREIHGRTPNLLNIIVVGQDFSSENADVKYHHPGYEQPPYHLLINVITNQAYGSLEILFTFPAGMYDEKDINMIYGHLINMLSDAIENQDKKTGHLNLLSAEEKDLLLNKFNDTERDYPLDNTVIEHFQKELRKNPDNIAAVYKDKKLTYRELNERANQIGRLLIEKGMKPDSIAGIISEPSLEMIVGTLGILKSGAAYMPIDPVYPAERIKYMMEDSGAAILLMNKNLYNQVKDLEVELIDMEDENIYRGDKKDPDLLAGPSNLAYIIYTSGSTGKPKGVMIEHRSLVNLCYSQKDLHNLTSQDRVSKYAGFAFDASVIEIFPALITGASLYVIDNELRMSPKHLNEYFKASKITRAFLPTQFVEQFMNIEDSGSLELVYTGGDKLRHFKKPAYRLINEYGPTEYTVCTSTFEVDKFYENIPVGKPVANTKIYIVDKSNNLQPPEVPGELCVSGAGIARGYLNRPDLTAEQFIDNPFEPGKKMYRTGDLARWLPDGNIEFLGRIDFQVKVRGFRIELGEIEKAILKFGGISETIVIARGDAEDDKYLCAYFIAEKKINISCLKERLLKDLPDYMVPSFFVQLDSMPLNPSGKIDRKALPEPEISSKEIVSPENIIEERLLYIWKNILGLEKISTGDNFFSIGGHSLKAARMQTEIEDTFYIEISFNDIFRYPTIKELADIIKSAQKVSLKTIEVVTDRDYYPVTSAQKRLYITEQLKGIGTTYNIPLILEIRGKLDKTKLIEAFSSIVKRHETLRTAFEIVKGEPVQKVYKEVKFKKSYREVSEKDVGNIIKNFIRPFELTKAPLFRIELLSVGPEKHIFIMDIHHTVFDGSSMVLFVKELGEFYKGNELPPLQIQYKDFSCWQKKREASEKIKKQEEFWLNSFKILPPVLDMPTDFPRPPVLQHEGNRLRSICDACFLDKLNRFAQKEGTTLYMVMMAALNILLAKYSGQEDIVIGMGSAGRNRSEVQNMIGMFVNTLPVRSYPEDNKTILDFLKETKEKLLEIYDNQDYQFEQLVEKLNIKRDPARQPLYDIGFVFQSMGFPKLELKDLTIKPHEYDHKIAHADIMLEVVEDDGKLFLNWEYRTGLFREETIERLAEHYKNILKSIINNPEQKLKDLNILSDEEKHMLLYDFNKADAAYPEDKTTHQIFEEMVRKYPDRTAVVCEDKAITYDELNKKANQLAGYLRKNGVKSDTIVGFVTDITIEMIVGILGIIKAGGCYLPIKPDFPEDRINYILENSGAPLLLTKKKYFHILKDYKGEIIDFLDEKIYSGSTENLNNINSPQDLIYIIYTSGSTGKPKGVMLKHRNVVRLFKNDKMNSPDYYDFNEHDVWSMFHSFCFDFSVWEIYGALLYGGKIIMVPKKVIVNPSDFLKLLKKEKVTVLSQTPAAFYNLIEEDLKSDDRDLSIRYVTFGGEELKPAMLEKWHKKYPETKLINMYGITETTVHVTYKEIGNREIEEKISNIGLPIPTLTTYIMDRNLKLLPTGIPGEICVGGEGLARGYLGLPEITADRFVENPYIKGEKIYRSGDLAKRLASGDLEYLGRIDFQVKIRGFRIELGEIENQLLKHDAVNKAVVMAKTDKEGNRFLVSYLVMEKEKDLTVSQLREHLLKDLPDYMVPSYFIKLDEMPLTPNGKVARKDLPDPDEHIDTGVDYVASRSDVEKKLVEIWQKVLGVEKISVLDNFFALGGHSLKAVSLVAELQHDFEVTVNDIFEYQTVANLAKNIKPKKDNLKSRLSQLKKVLAEDIKKETTPEEKKKIEEYREKNKKYEGLDYSKQKDYENILLTGTTGYLGIHLLYELMLEKKAGVYLIVRGESEEQVKKRLLEKLDYYFGPDFYKKHSERIIILKGNLEDVNLGLSPSVYKELAEKIDSILHPAAIVKHYGHYEEFYKSNVLATLNLLELAKTGKKKDLHHVSTLSVADGYAEGKDHILFGEYDYDLGQRSDNYYVKSKFEAEKAVMDARKEGINTSIYRVGNISINSRTGYLQQNIEENAFYLLVKSFINIGAVPAEDDEVEFSFVDYLSKAIVLLFDRANLLNETHHLMNSNTVKVSEILMSPELNLNIDKPGLSDFIDYLYENYEREGFKPYIENIMLHKGWLSKLDDLTKKHTTFSLLTDKTNLILKDLNFQWPEFHAEKLHKMVIKGLTERIEFLMEVPLFSSLSAEAIGYIAGLGRQEYYEEENYILWEGEENNKFYVIIDGITEISKHSRSGWLGTIGVAGPGEFLGEGNILNGSASSVTVEAIMGNVRIISFKGEILKEFMKKYTEFSMSFLREINKRVNKLQSVMVNLG